jgi:hypothetical protein
MEFDFLKKHKRCNFAVRLLFGDVLRVPGVEVLIAVSLAGYRG